MCEITKYNFKEMFPEIQAIFKKAKFFSIDLEFSALNPYYDTIPSFFDTNQERYNKLRENIINVIPLQIGITAFQVDDNSNEYFGNVYNFYVFPSPFSTFNKFLVQVNSFEFLCIHNFNFNKFIYSGIPYINKEDEKKMKLQLQIMDLKDIPFSSDIKNFIKKTFSYVKGWFDCVGSEDVLKIPDIKHKYITKDIINFMHKFLRTKFKYIWTYETNNIFCIRKVSANEFKDLNNDESLQNDIINYALGFRLVFDLLVNQKKPIIGHNVMYDFMIMFNNFEHTLPTSYTRYKQLLHSILPNIYDTKHLFHEIRSRIPKEKFRIRQVRDLCELFQYFKRGAGRSMVPLSPAIRCDLPNENSDNFHNAAWDSYCTGYVFLRIAYLNAFHQQENSKYFNFTQVMTFLQPLKNRINVIRGYSNHIKLDGEDPSSRRPPWILIEPMKNEPIDIDLLFLDLKNYGMVDVKKISSNSVLVAADNIRTVRKIKEIYCKDKYYVRQFPIGKNIIIKRILWTTIACSGSYLLWKLKKNLTITRGEKIIFFLL